MILNALGLSYPEGIRWGRHSTVQHSSKLGAVLLAEPQHLEPAPTGRLKLVFVEQTVDTCKSCLSLS